MYPDTVIFGLTLYDIMLCIGIVLCFIVFSYLADKQGVKHRIQSFVLICGVAAVILGYCSAVLFQAMYNIKSQGGFVINSETGATFYGGLIGGAAVFLALYFGIGRLLFKSNHHARSFFAIADSAAPGIAFAHCLGRIGCLCAGCCHGALTDAWYGIEMTGDLGVGKYVPVQLFEAVFLLILATYLFLRAKEKKGLCLPIYLSVYGVWRFIAEFMRGDDRGDVFISSLSPSQLIACILTAVGIGLIFLERYLKRRFPITVEENKSAQKEEDNEKAQ